MKNQLKVLITEERNEFGISCVKALEKYGCNVTVTAKDGNYVLAGVERHKPDVLIMEAFMPGLPMPPPPMLGKSSVFWQGRLPVPSAAVWSRY